MEKTGKRKTENQKIQNSYYAKLNAPFRSWTRPELELEPPLESRNRTQSRNFPRASPLPSIVAH